MTEGFRPDGQDFAHPFSELYEGSLTVLDNQTNPDGELILENSEEWGRLEEMNLLEDLSYDGLEEVFEYTGAAVYDFAQERIESNGSLKVRIEDEDSSENGGCISSEDPYEVSEAVASYFKDLDFHAMADGMSSGGWRRELYERSG